MSLAQERATASSEDLEDLFAEGEASNLVVTILRRRELHCPKFFSEKLGGICFEAFQEHFERCLIQNVSLMRMPLCEIANDELWFVVRAENRFATRLWVRGCQVFRDS